MNIISLAMQYLGPAIISKIASAFGIKNSFVTNAIAAALPSIMAALAGRASSSAGARSLFDVVSKQDTGLLDNLGSLIGGSRQTAMVNSGNDILSSLLGGNALGSLTKAVGQHAGISGDVSKSLMGMLAPVALGTLGQQVKENDLDASGLSRFLTDQKSNIANALPQGFDRQLAGTGLLDSISDQLQGASRATRSAVRDTVSDSRETVRSSGLGNLLPWILIALVGLGLLWYFFSGSGPHTASRTTPTQQSLMVGDVNVGNKFSSVVDNLTAAFGTIKDAGSAQAALPKLAAANTDLDKIMELAGKLPADGRSSLASTVAAAIEKLKPLIDAALNATGAGPIIKPAVELLAGKLNQLAAI